MSRLALITADSEFSHRIKLAARDFEDSFQSFQANFLPAHIDDVFSQLVGDPVEVLVLGPDLKADEVFRFASDVNIWHPQVSIVYAAAATPENVLGAMRAGVRDIVEPDSDVDALRAQLHRASDSALSRHTAGTAEAQTSTSASATPHGRVIAVMSPKGGVGKTTIATNLAVGLGKIAPMSVVIVDADLQFGDVASGLMLKPVQTITDAARGPRDALSLKTYLTPHGSNIYALCAPANPADADGVSPAVVTELIDQLAENFQYVVVDTSPGLGDHVLALLEKTSDVVWVCGMDIPSIRGLRNGLDILGEVNMLPPGRHVVLNMADRHSGVSVHDVEASIGVPVDVQIPRSRSIPMTTNRGVPALQDGLRDPSVKSLRALVDRFALHWEPGVGAKR
ncbi:MULTISPECIES: AAA family ATPase [Arthrobacter]|uniref:AAA family ATPase n=2 Tax=Arthrobacter TaxID=1663 RepID=A0ABU9KFV0_9MICC|nr:AAA family ATPase [Arthrobacter sp. YJM1]MDP5225760.1 AAA family ATPase [Arthrobacter sp. YJM1]